MEKELKILLIEDNTRDAELVEHELHKLDIEFVFKRVDTEKEYLKSIKEFSPDIILSDYNLLSWNGMRALELAQKNCPKVPFLIVTGSINEETAVECLKAGASDYITKEHLIRLVEAIKGAIHKQKKEELLGENQAMLKIITENVTDLIAILDLEGKRIYNSSSYEKLFGTAEHLQGTDSFANIYPDDREKIRKVFKETIETGVGRASEYRCTLKDGSIRHIESQGNLIRDAQGNPSKVLVVARDVTERKKKEKELNVLAHAIKSISECVSLTDKDNKLYFVNDTFLKTYGYTEDELLGKHISILRPEKDGFSPVPDIHAATLKDSWYGELLNRKKDGTIFPIYLSTSPVQDDKGEVLALIGVATDITERKRIEEALVKSRDFYLKLFEEFPTLIWRAGVNGKRNYTNKTMLDFTGRSFEQELGDGWIKGIHPEDLNVCLPKFFSTFKNRITLNIEYRLRRYDGVYRWIMDYGRPFYDLEGIFAGYIGSCHDITDIKEANQKLKESEERYRQFFEDDLTGDFISTVDGKFIACNQAYAKIFGFDSVDDALKSTAKSVYRSSEEREKFLDLLRKEKKLENYEIELVHQTGRPVNVIENVYGLFDEKGELKQIRGYLFDNTEHKKLEARLLQSQKMEAIGTLAGGIAHDFNNVMGIILGALDMIEQKGGNKDALRFVEMGKKAVERGAGVAKQLLLFSRSEKSDFKLISLHHIVNEVLNIVRHSFPKNIELEMKSTMRNCIISGDSGQIHQALLNLCVNARDAMPSGGVLSIQLRSVKQEDIIEKFPTSQVKNYVVLSVNDNGSGMTKEVKQRIFDPFFTTKERGRGTGLGLSIIYGIVNSHNAFIDVDSEVGKGTTFSIYFPTIESPTSTSDEIINENIIGGNEMILVVEDEEHLLDVVTSTLRSVGYGTITAKDGVEGLNVYKEQYREIHLVLSDLALPKISAEQMFIEMKKVNPNIKTIIATGYVEPGTKSSLLNKGVKNILQKPLKMVELLKTVREILDLK